jgi:hypothetical protein
LLVYGYNLDPPTGEQHEGIFKEFVVTEGITNVDFNIIDKRLMRFSIVCQILKKKWEYNSTIHHLLIDFKKTYYSVRRKYYTVFVLSLKYPGN